MKVELSVSIYLWKLRAKVKFSFDRKVVLIRPGVAKNKCLFI